MRLYDAFKDMNMRSDDDQSNPRPGSYEVDVFMF